MATTLYVGNLPWATTEDDLIRTFSEHGTVHSARIITDRETGRSRGFGFVEVADEDAERCIEALHGTEMGGREITVNVAQGTRH